MATKSQNRIPVASERIDPGRQPSSGVRAELEYAALRARNVGELSGPLFGKLRKSLGSDRFDELLGGIRYLASEGTPAGVRLLAAFLDLATMAERLLPHLSAFSSSRRYFLTLHADQRKANAFGRSWVARLVELSKNLKQSAPPDTGPPASLHGRLRPGFEHPWFLLRTWLAEALERLPAAGEELTPALRSVKELLRLEVDALEERASLLAGAVDPFRTAAVHRLLPILSELDGRIRDARTMISWLESGRLDEVLERPVSRALESLEPGEFQQLRRAMRDSAEHAPLSRLLERRIATRVDRSALADDVLRLQMLGRILQQDGVTGYWDNPLRAAAAAVDFGEAGGVRIPLDGKEAASLTFRLPRIEEGDGELDGVRLEENGTVLCLPRRAAGAMKTDWLHGLPVFADGALLTDAPVAPPPAPDAEPEQEVSEEMGASEAKKLVLNALQTTSILLALLRNPKITSVPGLVAEVATRTRNPQVISVIAADRTLHTGFANRDVPLACLRNPSNVSVKVLRKFIHVKFVSKVDLKRMSLDRAGIRRELRSEIDKYLEALT